MTGTDLTPFQALLQSARNAAGIVASGLAFNASAGFQLWKSVDRILSKPDHPVFSTPEAGGITALHIAAEFGRTNVVRKLLKNDEVVCCMRTQTGTGLSALHMAALSGHHEIVHLLNEHKDPLKGSFNKRDDPEPHSFGAKHRRMNSTTILPSFLRLDSLESYCSLSSTSPMTESNLIKDVHRTVLHSAAENGHVRAVIAICKSSQADVTSKDYDGYTPLHLAILNCGSQNLKPPWWNQEPTDHVAVIRTLVKSSRMNVNIESDGPDGDTPLHSSVRMQDPDVVELLCGHPRILATKRNSKGLTPLRLAWDQDYQSDALENIKEILLKRRDVQTYVDGLRQEREVLYSGANSLLVGGTLLASFAFAGVLEMPTRPDKQLFEGKGPQYATPDLLVIYTRVISIFRVSNYLCFFMSILTAMLAIQVPISKRHTRLPNLKSIESEVDGLRVWTVYVSFTLTLSTAGAVLAFVSCGLAKIPITESKWSVVLATWHQGHWMAPYKSNIITCSLLGLSVWLLILLRYFVYDYFFILRKHFRLNAFVSRFRASTGFILVIFFVVLAYL